jgi:DNA-binding transcriptional regulator YiaG
MSRKSNGVAARRPNPYGPIIAAARVKHGLSQPHAAEAIGVSLTTIRSWEQGKRAIPVERRSFLAEQWGIDRKELGLDLGVCPCCQRPL